LLAEVHEDLLDVAAAQGEAVVEPDPMADDLAGKAVVLVPLGSSVRGHIGYLSWGAVARGGIIVGVIMSRVEREDQ